MTWLLVHMSSAARLLLLQPINIYYMVIAPKPTSVTQNQMTHARTHTDHITAHRPVGFASGKKGNCKSPWCFTATESLSLPKRWLPLSDPSVRTIYVAISHKKKIKLHRRKRPFYGRTQQIEMAPNGRHDENAIGNYPVGHWKLTCW